MDGSPHPVIAAILAVALIIAFVALIMWLTRSVNRGRHRVLALIGLCVVIYLAGIWLWPIWFSLLLVPILGWFILKPDQPEGARWDREQAGDRYTARGGRRDRDAELLAEGRCPDCGASNPPGQERCQTCNRLLEVY